MLSASSSKYDMIMKASVSLFTERGFDATTIPMIAERAHVGTGTIYRYFDSKETLVNVLFQESIQRFTEKLKQDVSELPVRRLSPRILLSRSVYERERLCAFFS